MIKDVSSAKVAAILMALVLIISIFNTAFSAIERQRIQATLEDHAALARAYVVKNHDCPKVNQGSETK